MSLYNNGVVLVLNYYALFHETWWSEGPVPPFLIMVLNGNQWNNKLLKDVIKSLKSGVLTLLLVNMSKYITYTT